MRQVARFRFFNLNDLFSALHFYISKFEGNTKKSLFEVGKGTLCLLITSKTARCLPLMLSY